jgi:hypothetical protein
MGITIRKSKLLQLGRFYNQKPGISTSHWWLQLSIWVLIISQHDQYVDCAVLVARSPPALRFAIWWLFVESQSNTSELRMKSALFHHHSPSIGRIANPNAGGKQAAKTEQSTYWPSHDTIRTHILNWSHSYRNCIVGTATRFEPAQRLMVRCPVQVTHPPRQSSLCSLAVPNLGQGLSSCSNPDWSRVTRNRCKY